MAGDSGCRNVLYSKSCEFSLDNTDSDTFSGVNESFVKYFTPHYDHLYKLSLDDKQGNITSIDNDLVEDFSEKSDQSIYGDTVDSDDEKYYSIRENYVHHPPVDSTPPPNRITFNFSPSPLLIINDNSQETIFELSEQKLKLETLEIIVNNRIPPVFQITLGENILYPIKRMSSDNLRTNQQTNLKTNHEISSKEKLIHSENISLPIENEPNDCFPEKNTFLNEIAYNSNIKTAEMKSEDTIMGLNKESKAISIFNKEFCEKETKLIERKPVILNWIETNEKKKDRKIIFSKENNKKSLDKRILSEKFFRKPNRDETVLNLINNDSDTQKIKNTLKGHCNPNNNEIKSYTKKIQMSNKCEKIVQTVVHISPISGVDDSSDATEQTLNDVSEIIIDSVVKDPTIMTEKKENIKIIKNSDFMESNVELYLTEEGVNDAQTQTRSQYEIDDYVEYDEQLYSDIFANVPNLTRSDSPILLTRSVSQYNNNEKYEDEEIKYNRGVFFQSISMEGGNKTEAKSVLSDTVLYLQSKSQNQLRKYKSPAFQLNRNEVSRYKIDPETEKKQMYTIQVQEDIDEHGTIDIETQVSVVLGTAETQVNVPLGTSETQTDDTSETTSLSEKYLSEQHQNDTATTNTSLNFSNSFESSLSIGDENSSCDDSSLTKISVIIAEKDNTFTPQTPDGIDIFTNINDISFDRSTQALMLSNLNDESSDILETMKDLSDILEEDSPCREGKKSESKKNGLLEEDNNTYLGNEISTEKYWKVETEILDQLIPQSKAIDLNTQKNQPERVYSIIEAIQTVEKELKPLRDVLSKLHSEFMTLEIPELGFKSRPSTSASSRDSHFEYNMILPSPPSQHEPTFYQYSLPPLYPMPLSPRPSPPTSPSTLPPLAEFYRSIGYTPRYHPPTTGHCNCVNSDVSNQMYRNTNNITLHTPLIDVFKEMVRPTFKRPDTFNPTSVWSEPEDFLGDNQPQWSSSGKCSVSSLKIKR